MGRGQRGKQAQKQTPEAATPQRSSKKVPTKKTAGSNVPLSSSDGRSKLAPNMEIIPPLPPSQQLLDILAPVETKHQHYTSYSYDDESLTEALLAFGVASATLSYSGGNDEGSHDGAKIVFADGSEEYWASSFSEQASDDDERLKAHFVNALWQPAADEFGSFAGEYSVVGTVSWTPDEGLAHSYNMEDNPDYCEACDEHFDAETVEFKLIYDQKEGWAQSVCHDCHTKIANGSHRWSDSHTVDEPLAKTPAGALAVAAADETVAEAAAV